MLPALGHDNRFYVVPDSYEYDQIAINVAGGHGYSESFAAPYVPDLRRTPVYPSLLAAIYRVYGHDPALAVAVNVILGTVTAVLVCRFSEIHVGVDAGLVAGLMVATDLTSAAYSLMLVTETLFTCVLVVSIAAFLSALRHGGWRAFLLPSTLVGMGILIRPISLFLPFFLGPTVVLVHQVGTRRAAAKAATLFVVVALSFPIVWTARNYLVTGVPQLTSIMAINAYYYRAVPLLRTTGGANSYALHQTSSEQAHLDDRQTPTSANLTGMERSALATVLRDPFGYAVLHFKGVMHLLGPDRDIIVQLGQDSIADRSSPSSIEQVIRSAGEVHLPPPSSTVSALSSAQLLILYGLAAVGAVAGIRRAESRDSTIVILVCLAYFLIISGPEAYPRFRVPMMPFIAVLASFGVLRLWSRIVVRHIRQARLVCKPDDAL